MLDLYTDGKRGESPFSVADAAPESGAGPVALGVIVRTLGRAHLGEALDSLAGQTRRDFETIVVDMSGRGTSAVVEHRRSCMRHLVHVSLPGPLSRADALNLGVAASRADVFAILDDDNMFTPGHVDTFIRGLAATDADLVYTGVRRQTLTPDGELMHEAPVHAPFDRDRLLFTNYIYSTGTAFRRAIWARVGGYDRRFRVYEDWEFLVRVAHAGVVAALPTVSGISRSFTGNVHRPSHHDEAIDCARCAPALFWVHRDKYSQALFDRNPGLARTHPEVPLGGTRAEYEPFVDAWLSQNLGAEVRR